MKRKIIINSYRYGRYWWSPAGVLAVLEKKGFSDLHLFKGSIYPAYRTEIDRDEFISMTPCSYYEWCICVGNARPENACRNGVYDYDDDVWKMIFNYSGFDREDPDAIAVLEELGSEYCSYPYNAELKIVEYDDGDGLFRCHIYDEIPYEDGGGCGSPECIELEPYLTESRVLRCSTVSEVLDLLRKAGIVYKD